MTKKKNKKSKAKVKENYKQYFLHYAYCLAIIALLTFASINVNKYIENQKVLGTSVDVTPIQNEKLYWEKVISDNPTYTDGYLELAKVNLELGNINEANNYIIKAQGLDPNSSKILEVKQNLGL